MIEAVIRMSNYFIIIRCKISKDVDKNGEIFFERLVVIVIVFYKYERSSEYADDMRSL